MALVRVCDWCRAECDSRYVTVERSGPFADAEAFKVQVCIPCGERAGFDREPTEPPREVREPDPPAGPYRTGAKPQ